MLYALTATVLLALVVAASTSGAAFGAFNPQWDGTADLRADADAHTDLQVVTDTEGYDEVDPEGTVAFVLAPQEPYDEADAARIRAFLEAGGTLVVADNFAPGVDAADVVAPGAESDSESDSDSDSDPDSPDEDPATGPAADTPEAPHANALLAAVGATARFDGDLLRDEEHYSHSPAMPIADDVADHPYTTDVDQLTLNYGTAVDPGAPDGDGDGDDDNVTTATPIVNTSTVAYLDRDRTGELSDDEELGTYPVVTVEPVGDGQVVAVGDPSVFINVMLEEPDNRAFLGHLLSAHDRTLLDVSRAGDQPPLVWALLSIRASVVLQFVVGLSLVGLAGVAVARPRTVGVGVARLRTALRRALGREHPDDLGRDGSARDDPAREAAAIRPDRDALAAHLREEHPDWNDERIRRVIAGVMPPREHDRDDE